ncbi:acyl-CoA dehydrogenase family protein [uncultured Jatrophihabitans sp.]|uniref:acyl-CoA dehydrogenase family protein n=1 Tax=uncultured Jatrophihabitans sp. TaxID=1610747 RepID=UPI0035CC66BA
MGAASTFRDEREALRDSVRAFLTKYSSEAQVRAAMATAAGSDPAVWRRMAQDLGLQGLAVPAGFGGSGFGATELQVVLEEMGRALLCSPFFSSAVLATNVLLASDDTELCQDVLPGLCDGNRVATVAATGDSGSWQADDVWDASAGPAGDGWTVTGRKNFVPDAMVADLLVVAARCEAGPTLFVVEATQPGVERSTLTTLDETRKQGTVQFASVPARIVGRPGRGAEILERALVRSAVALAAEQVGGARRALELAVDYAKVREQFGRVIGSFQAVKQKCADMLLAVEAATSASRAAAEAVDAGGDDTVALAHLALGLASEAYVHATTESIEVHGGIGFTWEASAHLYYKRALAGAALLGSPASHRSAMLAAMGR